jgi:hypothetical protein
VRSSEGENELKIHEMGGENEVVKRVKVDVLMVLVLESESTIHQPVQS